jgi:hypothetical protein
MNIYNKLLLQVLIYYVQNFVFEMSDIIFINYKSQLLDNK